MKNSNLLKNSIILGISPLLALGLFFVTGDLHFFKASVLDLDEMAQIKQKQWGVAYKVEDQHIELFGSEALKKGKYLIFEILYNPEKVHLVTSTQEKSFELIDHSSGVFQGKLTIVPVDSREEGIFQLAFSGEESQLVLASAKLISHDMKQESLSIGNIGTHHEHSFLP